MNMKFRLQNLVWFFKHLFNARKRIPLSLLGFLLFFSSTSLFFCSSNINVEDSSPVSPKQLASGPGGATYNHATVTKNVYGQGAEQYWLFEPASPTPESAPIIVFNHGWGSMYPYLYGAWIEHLVRRGNIVVYPRYQATLRTPKAEMTDSAINAIKNAIARLQNGRHITPLLDKFAIVGHSVGAVISANIAAEANDVGLPEPKALMFVQPEDREKPLKQMRFGKGYTGSILGDCGKIPATTLILVVSSSEDERVGNTYAEKIFNESFRIPLDNKNMVTVVSDYYSVPPLVADHFSPCAPDDDYAAADENLSPRQSRIQRRIRERLLERLGEPELDRKLKVDALDYYGYWKLLDGLTDAAFYGKNREYALGNTAQQRFMGLWSDGTPVKELIVFYDALIPSEDKIFSHITAICKQGIRRSGYPADVWTENYIKDKFIEYGLEDVHFEKVTHTSAVLGQGEPRIAEQWTPINTSLTVYNESESITVPAFSVPYSLSTGPEGIDLPIVALESKRINRDAQGKIALYPLKFRYRRQRLYTRMSQWNYDPNDSFSNSFVPSLFSIEQSAPMKYAIDSGASGFIGVLTNVPNPDTYEYYVPFPRPQGEHRSPIPGVYISENSGNKIKELMKSGSTKAKLVSESIIEPVVTRNVMGTLRGKSDDWIIIHCHHDGAWASAVEGASGIALVLAQAEYWSKVPVNERPHNMLFMGDSGHLIGVAGAWTFIQNHKDLLEKIVLDISLEHVALEYEGRNGKLVPTGRPQARWWFSSSNVIELVRRAIKAENIDRSIVFREDAFGPYPLSDGGFFFTEGVPLVNLSGAPFYLYLSDDTPEKVDKKALVPITRAVIHIINGLDGISAAQLRNK